MRAVVMRRQAQAERVLNETLTSGLSQLANGVQPSLVVEYLGRQEARIRRLGFQIVEARPSWRGLDVERAR